MVPGRCILLAAAATVVAVATPLTAAAQTTARQVVRVNVEQLHRGGAIRFTGSPAQRTIVFELNRRWKPARGSALHLVVQHAPNLDPARSFLSVSVNYGIVRTIPLTRENAAPTRVVIPIPPNLFSRENQIEFMVEQFPSDHAAADEVWTTIDRSSFIHIEGVRGQAPLDLAELPDAFIDGSRGRPELAVLRPTDPTPETLEGTARLVANLAKALRPQVLAIRVVTAPDVTGPLLVVGTPREQPGLARLQPVLPLALDNQPGRTFVTRRSGPPLRPDEGLVGLGSRARGERVLFATANTPGAVHRAAMAALTRKTLARAVATVRPEPVAVAPAARAWSGYVPPRGTFTLGDVLDGNLKIPLDASTPLVVPLNVTPDARFFKYGHRVTLRISANGAYFSPDARLHVQWNNTPLAEYRAGDIFANAAASVPISIPAQRLQARNLLTVQWQHPAAENRAAAAAWLLADSEFFLPRYYQAELPDLALLQARGYPLSLRADLSDVAVVVPDAFTGDVFGALLEVSAALGRLSPGDALMFRVIRASELTDDERAGLHLVLLHSNESANALLPALAERRRLLWPESPQRDPVIQEVVSPWRSDRFILSLTAVSDPELRRFVTQVLAEPTLRLLTGDAASLTPQGPVGEVMTPPRRFGTYSYITASDAWLRTHWVALPMIVTFVSGLFFVACRLALRSRLHRSSY
jgi:cellulose synthase operon protein B